MTGDRVKNAKRPNDDRPARSQRRHRRALAAVAQRRRWQALAAAALASVIAAAALLIFLPPGQPLRSLVSSSSPGAPRAAILDQLDLTFPNPGFIRTATDMLEQAGYEVDYYRGREVTVELYRNLPEPDYDVVILRVHSGLVAEVDETTGSETLTDYVSLFTGESYTDTRYVEEVREGPLGVASTYEGGPEYFGIGPTFVESRMNGKFDDTTIILMGCDGLRAERMANAFLNRGAAMFISWDKPVSATHTDAATERLLRHLYVDQHPAPEAVKETMAEVGPDPTFDSELLFYPTGETR